MPSPVRGASGDRPLTDIPVGLMNMLASTLRGTTKATLGLPGDIESLGRMGLNAMGAGVDKKSVIPDTEQFGEMLPKGPHNPSFEKLGEFMPAPTGLGAAIKGGKKASQMVKALRGAPEPVMDVGRRGALKVLGAGAAAAALPGVGMKLAKELAPAVHAGEGLGAKAAAGQVAKAAAHVWNPAEVYSLTKPFHDAHYFDLGPESLSPETIAQVTKHFKNPEELKNVGEWSKHWNGNDPEYFIEPYKPFFDAKKAQTQLNSALEASRAKYGLKPGEYHPDYRAEAQALKNAHFPESAKNPEIDDYWKISKKFDAEVPVEKVQEVLKYGKPGEVPPEWAKMGVTPHMIADRFLNAERAGTGGINEVMDHVIGDYLNSSMK